MRPLFCLSLLVLLSGCARKTVRVPTHAGPLAVDTSYLDLEPGWRLRVITPLLRSGGYLPKTVPEQTAGNTVTFSAGNDFLGYETDYYAVTKRKRAGVRITLSSAETTKDGTTTQQEEPVAHLFQLPHNARYVRLLYLQRMSEADHNMAVLASNRTSSLQTLTEQVETNPSTCISNDSNFCSWIPVGIAVRPERQQPIDGVPQWTPAR
jgi:hypothetical protein